MLMSGNGKVGKSQIRLPGAWDLTSRSGAWRLCSGMWVGNGLAEQPRPLSQVIYTLSALSWTPIAQNKGIM